MSVAFGRSRWSLLCSVVCSYLLVMVVSVAPVLAKELSAPTGKFGITQVELYPELAEDLGLPREQKGLAILGVFQGSPAEEVKLQPGDVIVRVQKTKADPVDVVDQSVWDRTLKDTPIDRPLTLTILRAGQEVSIPVKRSPAEFGPCLQPPAGSTPQVIRVIPGGGGEARTLHGGLVKARPGDTLLLQGSFTWFEVWLKDLTVASLDPARPAVVQGIWVTAPGVRLKDLSVVAPTEGAPQNGVTLVGAAGGVVEKCRIEGFTLGLVVSGAQGVVLEGNTLSGNAGGIVVVDQAQVKLAHNFVRRNALVRQGQNPYFIGGIVVSAAQAEIVSNTIIENSVSGDQFSSLLYEPGHRPGAGIMLWPGAAAQVYSNIVAQNNIGVMVDVNAQASIEYNDVYGHLIQSKVWSPANGVQANLQGGNSNFLSGINQSYQPPGSGPASYVYTPVLQFQPSPTNVSADPLFANPLKGDYRLAADSPLVNRGRGGTYIGAFAPVGYAAPAATTAAPGGTAGPGAGTAGAPSPSAARGPEATAQLQGGVLYLPAPALDGLVARLKRRAAENPAVKERVGKAPVGVVPFGLVAGPGLELSRDLGEDLTTALINSGFRLADRGALAKALGDLKISDSSQVDQEAAREVGRRTGGALLLVGTVSDRVQTVVLNVRLLDSETGDFLAAERMELPKAKQ